MNTDYIIVQAGGPGTRLGKLTRNRPKCLVPVNNRPIIFHLFERFHSNKFIIIGDYRFEVLERYLRTFARVDYVLIRAEGSGNSAGLRRALSYLPCGAQFLLLWSDLILDCRFQIPEDTDGCTVGVTDVFPCSWRFQNGYLRKGASEGRGVAGCFLLRDKALLNGLPETGSFASWLAGSDLALSEMDMLDSREAGTAEAIRSIDSGDNRCRPYNHMEFTEDRVIKTGLTEEGRQLIRREERWYERVSDYGFQQIPRIYASDPLTMGRIQGENIFRAELSEAKKRDTLDRLFVSLDKLHNYEHLPRDCPALEKEYYLKTLQRLQGIRETIPFANDSHICINGILCRNVFFFEEELRRDVQTYLYDTEFGPIHGDCTLTNTMIDQAGNIYFIDARGYFGSSELCGDVYYDWAKLYYSIQGRFDKFNVKAFDFEITDSAVYYTIEESGWENLTGYFLDKLPEGAEKKIKLIHAIIWLSLASHCWEDYDSMCLAFYNGLALWEEWNQYIQDGGEKYAN